MTRGVSRARLACLLLSLSYSPAFAGGQQPLSILDVPFISQSEALCGGAAAAMVLRYWGERGLTAESFSHLVDRSAAGIRTTALLADLRRRGWEATAIEGTNESLTGELSRGRPVLTLIQDRPGTFHYIVIVAVTERSVIFHDPARAPFRVMLRAELERRWDAADRWMAVVVPGPRPDQGISDRRFVDARPAPSTSCEQLVADGVRQAQAEDLAGAERSLTSALSCPGSAPLRELAGVRVLQKRWPDVTELAAAAVDQDPRDEYAWRLLATGRFLGSEPVRALEAWNKVGEPRLDLIQVSGLTRTRPRVVERIVGVDPGNLLTPARLTRAGRRLNDLPSATAARVAFVPLPAGLAELRADVAERPLVPSDWWSLGAIGLAAATTREVKIATGSFAGGGERLGLEWRFWPNRPRLAIDLAAPAPWGGVWSVGGFAERQPFDTPDVPTSERLGGRLTASNWATSSVRWTVRGGLDRWNESGAFGAIGGAMTIVALADRVTARLDVDSWLGGDTFTLAQATARVRSSPRQEGFVVEGRFGGGVATMSAPADLWFTGDTGNARPVLLRAHPLVEDGRFRTNQMGRAIGHGSVEAQRWWRVSIVRLGTAVFVDAVRVTRRQTEGPRSDVDVGGGARVSVPGRGGIVRIDLAKGLRDGATRLSLMYEP